jgi:hypothetical protein
LRPIATPKALEFFHEVTEHGLVAEFWISHGREEGVGTAQVQVKVYCFGDQLIWVAQQANERDWHVDAEDGALLINVP